MRHVAILLFVIGFVAPAAAHGQSFEVYGSAGPNVTDAGSSVAAGAGFSPTSRITLLFSVERTHLASQITREENTISTFRGGTLVLVSAELRVTPLGRSRWGPYGVAGLADGVSSPNVNEIFPDRATRQRVHGVFAGGGVQVPLGRHATIFGDFRMMLGMEGNEGMVATGPLRAGVGWRF